MRFKMCWKLGGNHSRPTGADCWPAITHTSLCTFVLIHHLHSVDTKAFGPTRAFGKIQGLRVYQNIIIHPASRGVAAVGAPQAREFSLFPPVGAPQAREFSLFPPVGAPQAREFSLFPAVTASQAMEFSLFPPLEALQAVEFQIARQRRLDSPPNPVFFECVSMFLQ